MQRESVYVAILCSCAYGCTCTLCFACCLPQGLLKAEGKARYGDAFSMWQKQAEAFSIDEHAPVRELWYR